MASITALLRYRVEDCMDESYREASGITRHIEKFTLNLRFI
jgi:hypothetical protein